MSMITSLNVNQFLKKCNWAELQGKYNEKNKIWNEIKDYYFRYIRNHIVMEEDLLVLHEVPFLKEVEYTYNGKIRFKRSEEIYNLYLELEEYCKENDLEILKPSTKEGAFFRTIAIFKKGAYKRSLTEIDKEFKQYANRIIALERTNAKTEEMIIGLHIPMDCKDYWDYLIAVHKELPKDKMIIYIGDLNTYMPGSINKNKFYELMSEGLIDVWIEKGNPHTKETFEGTRIDYVLMTGKDFCNSKYEITIDDTIRKQGYSDHSAIIMM